MANGLLAVCSACAQGLEVAALTGPALIEALVGRLLKARRRGELARRLQASCHERDLAVAGIRPWPHCGRFRRLLASRHGAAQPCRICTGAIPIGDLGGQ